MTLYFIDYGLAQQQFYLWQQGVGKIVDYSKNGQGGLAVRRLDNLGCNTLLYLRPRQGTTTHGALYAEFERRLDTPLGIDHAVETALVEYGSLDKESVGVLTEYRESMDVCIILPSRVILCLKEGRPALS